MSAQLPSQPPPHLHTVHQPGSQPEGEPGSQLVAYRHHVVRSGLQAQRHDTLSTRIRGRREAHPYWITHSMQHGATSPWMRTTIALPHPKMPQGTCTHPWPFPCPCPGPWWGPRLAVAMRWRHRWEGKVELGVPEVGRGIWEPVLGGGKRQDQAEPLCPLCMLHCPIRLHFLKPKSEMKSFIVSTQGIKPQVWALLRVGSCLTEILPRPISTTLCSYWSRICLLPET